MAGSEDAGHPFWSPDAKSVGFVGGGKLKRVEAVGGSPIELCNASAGHGGSCSDDGVILFADRNAVVQRISASGTPYSAQSSFPYWTTFTNNFIFEWMAHRTSTSPTLSNLTSVFPPGACHCKSKIASGVLG